MKPMVEPTLVAIPLFFALMYWEYRVMQRRTRAGDTSLVGYERRDTVASLCMGVGSLLFAGVLHLLILVVGMWWWRFRMWDVGTGWASFGAAMLAWDFTFYWQHRFEHVVHIGWASHVNHHSSLHYNLSTALRQEWTPFAQLVLFPLWSLVGIHPYMLAFAGGLNLIYQYWIHTEVIDRLPRWFEFVFNTPSHHRVHHGSNPQYLDKNYGGILILWDRLFGTFEPEVERVRYGLTKNINSFKITTIAFHEWRSMLHSVRHAGSVRNAFGYLFRGPGWKPAAEMSVAERV